MTKIRITWAGLIEGAQVVFWVLMLAVGIWSAATVFAAMVKQISVNEIRIGDHEERLRHNEETLQQIATDLRLIRYSLEDEEVVTLR